MASVIETIAEEIVRIKHFSNQKNEDIFYFIDEIKVNGFPWKSEMEEHLKQFI